MARASFPFATRTSAVPGSAAATIDLAALQAMATTFAASVGVLLGAECSGSVDAAVPAIPAEAPGYARDDGLWLALDLPRALAELVTVRRCGGPLRMAELAGNTAAPSVVRAFDRLADAAMRAADRAWRAADTGWRRCDDLAGDGEVTAVTIRLELAMLGFELGLRVRAAPSAPASTEIEPPRAPLWRQDLHRLLGATALPVRAVLHERLLPLAAAARLQPGDVLPIDAPRTVQLRVGNQGLGRGTVAPLGEDGALLVTITARLPGAPPPDAGDAT